MPKSPVLLALASLLLSVSLSAQQHARDAEIVSQTKDPDTLAWWHTTEALSNDAMEGRDTGTAAYQRAADYVATRFKQAGLQPAGDSGTYFQTVPMHEVAVDPAATSFALIRNAGGETPIAFLQQITLAPATNIPAETLAPLTFRGYCGQDSMQDIAGKIVVCFGTQRQGLPSGGERVANARAGRALGLINVDDPFFTIEPPRWPYAYARTVALGPPPPQPSSLHGLLVMRMDSTLLASFLQGTQKDASAILAAGGHKQPLPSFEIPAKLRVHLKTTQRTYSSPNILAVLPGSDPVLKNQYIVIAAHLDGYGFGTPVLGDNLYNGALDDAAYVALLIQFAGDLHAHPQPLKRSVLFCAFTGEEKGLLGSTYFVAHPTIPIPELAADINLDQLRPLFPLHILTALAVDDTTLGASARQVGASMGIEIRPDREPERGLLRRADHAPFLRAGVPAIGFIFGYDPGTDAEKRYRTWYQIQYHRPQDDLTQPIDFAAAAKFDHFFYTLTETLANDPTRPSILPNSPLAK
jgi:hypothetical protein